jgi:amidase
MSDHSFDDFLALDATAQSEVIANGDVSRAEAVDAAIARAEKINPTINAIIHPRYDRARADAESRDDGPFAGVPMVVKDLGCPMAGEPMHLGTRFLKDAGFVAPHDSHLARRFARAGFVVIGRTNTPEFGSTITTEPLSYGPSRNPWNLDHSTGGSSGGSAAAVAAGIVAVGHANDGGGSIRIPASECGLVGLKPSRGRVSVGPDIGESWAGLSIDGVVTRSVRDTAAVLDEISGYEPGDPYTAPEPSRPYRHEVGADPGRLRIGLLEHPLFDFQLNHPESAASVRDTARLLEDLGHHVETAWPARLGDDAYADIFPAIVAVYTAADIEFFEKMLGRAIADEELELDNMFLRAMGRGITSSAHVANISWLHSWSREVVSWWHPIDPDATGFDVLVTPTLAGPPPRLGELSGEGAYDKLREILAYTSWFNVTGQPAVSLPLHMSTDGLPMGVQFVGAPNREDMLIRLAAQLESAAPWARRRPPLG